MTTKTMDMLKINKMTVRKLDDPVGDLDFLKDPSRYEGCEDAEKYMAQDAERVASYGESWTFVGIDAVAEIVVSGIIQTITSGGLWGIESDSGEDFLRETGAEQLDALADILRTLGFDEDAIVTAPKEWVL